MSTPDTTGPDTTGRLVPDPEIVDLLTDFFAREVTPQIVESAEQTGSLHTALWARAESVQIPWIGIDEDAGGVGGSSADVVALLQLAGHRATPLPLVEHHVAATLVARAGLDQVEGMATVAGISAHEDVPSVVGGTVTGRIGSVPWAADAAAVVVLTTDESGRDVAAVVRRGDYTVEPSVDIAGVPVPTVVLDGAPAAVGEVEGGGAAVRRYAEVMRAAFVAGLTQRLYDITAEYTSERHQFGKPVGSFQSVQMHVVTLAQSASMSLLSVERAAGAVALGAGDFEVDAMSVVVAQNAVRSVAAAHQAHGAIGMTREYPLQQVTRRIHALRQVWDAQSDIELRVGRAALAAPSLSELIARHPEEGLQSA